MAVQQHVLNWLYSVLTSEYHDVNRTYNDVAQALSQYPSLSPRTDVHTFPNGTSALLLHLTGTIPVLFRGTTYRFPISLWVPHAYPREAPLVYVTPTETMVVRPGQHVDPQGQVYHPYLVGWTTFWDKSTILDFLAILRDVFAKEPPVIARQQTTPQPDPQPTATPPPVPPLPPDLAPRPGSNIQSPPHDDLSRPPPPPPKPGVQSTQQTVNMAPPNGPPVPPLPPQFARPASQYGPGPPVPPGQQQQYRPQSYAQNAAGPSRYESAPPLPPQGQQPLRSFPPPSQTSSPPAVASPPYQGARPQSVYQQGPPQQPFQPADPRGAPSTFPPPQGYGNPPQPWQQQHAPPPPVQAQPKPKPPPPPDIMDEPLTLNIPNSSNVPAPPIPPNPEKDALLHQLAQTLHAMRARSRAHNDSSLQGLQAQRTAMLTSLEALQSDLSSLSSLSALLSSNTSILKSSLRQADAVIESSARQEPPAVDELLVAPTVVGNQLYDLVAEERALGDAIFMLGRAVERGRVAPATFAKMTRSLAREWFLKKALVKKIGRGMGLAS
ncbi:UEV-domain-containing protein [Coniochaeta ligniaria NRRL 30616]|uniref:UEV-domain-containing protein n=1 Tax=Coniochaeta ligniaria NRRL 30616 TaxID=1408157 RepID=A0A1J7JN81_9PEZI|nr:UEV-domain-containing protein [Coniochaeta ligniaria NRRL 30616]